MYQKYSMILVSRVILDTGESHDVCRLVKALPEAGKLNFADLSEIPITTMSDLISAAKDIKKEGVSTWHYDNGKFSTDFESGALLWTLTDSGKKTHASSPVKGDEELYAIYGGD